MKFNGKILKKIREQRGIIQTEICDAINLHQSLYSKYERGVVKEPPATVIKDIADYLGLPYESFFGDFDEPVLINQTSGIPERIDVHVHVMMSKFTEEQLEFLQEYIELGEDEEGLPYISSVKCSIKGDVRGKIEGSVLGKIEGDVYGDIEGDVGGNIRGSVRGKIEGDVGGIIGEE